MGSSFRPRPLDIFKPLEVLHDDIEDEDSRNFRSVPDMPTGMDAEEEKESHIKQAILAAFRTKIEIPIPTIKDVENYSKETPSTFRRPPQYIKYIDKTVEEFRAEVDYDMDDADEEFLAKLNKDKFLLSEDKFELMIDRMEKETCERNDFEPITQFRAERLIGGAEKKTNRLQVIAAVYNYWVKKREALGHSLLHLYHRPKADTKDSAFAVFRPIEQKKKRHKGVKNDFAVVVRLRQLRQEFEKSRTLLEMVKKREKMKREYIMAQEALFFARLADTRAGCSASTPKKKRRLVTLSGAEAGGSELDDGAQSASSSGDESDAPSEDMELSAEEEEDAAQSPYAAIVTDPIMDHPFFQTYVFNIPGIPPFRGRGRIGRGGRMIFDRHTLLNYPSGAT